jgi:malate/lactate dehydrogenase
VIDRRGVENVLRLELSPDEIEKLRHSASMLKAVVEKLKL